ncbi:glutathionylspermidine synthase family protein [Helicobacter sp. 11S02629-2]|uniref:glutathionylspermidine synthase family protein n=1 Tax=Helicobacter sp. 11S02629-2 TaxID=1476195 RepID=UPI000BA77D6D|nr:glutathionylspermidine synthase family protein [Helicobacter sp. 11S02629-2]PAF45700.1 glutathionylspermidine synthase [Helicobacter sp. 11S02629-2]
MDISKIKLFTKSEMESLGLSWHTDIDGSDYISDELIHVSQKEADSYYDACEELYSMYVEGAEHVIANNLFHDLDIPNALIAPIIQSFEEDIHWHIYGRFDLAGGLDGKPIKLLEFNADTPTSLYETSSLQWGLLKFNGMDESLQFNNIYQAISDNFKRLITLDSDLEEFERLYEGWRMLFSSIRGSDEEEITVKFLQDCARHAGFETNFCYVDEVQLDSAEGTFFNDENYEFWFKLIPWENIAIDEPELAAIMANMMDNKNTIFINPAYTVLFQSKRMLKILWDLFPNHPLLLPASYEPLSTKQVLKPSFGREGNNVQILDANKSVIKANDGIYANHKPLYQEFYELNESGGNFYQPQVFYAYEPCGLGFRKGSLIMDNYAKFVSHIIK